ncbi:MAG: iron-containing alcohol dehydrogenase, partial [Janthinobacterium sp.]
SAMNGYPYTLKALILWSCNPVYGITGLRAQIGKELADPKKIPLIVAIDPFINESSAFADYLLPDTLLYESWGWAGAWGGMPVKMSTARWPVVEPRVQKTPDGQTICMESFFIALAKTMDLPGFGSEALQDMDGQRFPLQRAEDWYLRGGANIAWQGKTAVPEASDDDIVLSGVARIRPELERTLKPEEWRKVAFMLARGGRYQSYGEMFGLRLPPPANPKAPASPAPVVDDTPYPQDWSTHAIGHELTALYELDHAQTLAIILPSMLRVRKQAKRAKLLQYAARVWGLDGGDEDGRIEAAIARTEFFFRHMGVKTRLADYGLNHASVDAVVAALEAHGMTALGEQREVTPAVSRKVLELSL